MEAPREGSHLAPPSENDRRTQILENLLQRVREDKYPSTTVLDMIESMLHDDDIDEYTSLLFEAVRDDRYPSMDLMRRLHSFL